MAWEEVIAGAIPAGEYWSPEIEGDFIEGNYYETTEDDYGHDRLVIQLENGNLTTLPSHVHLMKYSKNIKIGDFIRVECTKIIPPRKEDGYPSYRYSVKKDPDRSVIWDSDSE